MAFGDLMYYGMSAFRSLSMSSTNSFSTSTSSFDPHPSHNTFTQIRDHGFLSPELRMVLGLCIGSLRIRLQVILHDRNRSKSSQVEKQLNTDFPLSKTRLFFLDSTETTEDLEKSLVGLENLNITVLVNTVGGLTSHPSKSYK